MDKILSDSALERLISRRIVKIDPKPTEKQLQPASIDLRLGQVYTLAASKKPVEPDSEPKYNKVRTRDGVYNLAPRRAYFFDTLEKVSIGEDVDEVYVAPRSSLARGLVNIIGLSGEVYYRINPPFKGKVFCLLYSQAFPLTISQGERVLQLVFIKRKDGVTRLRRLHSETFLKPIESAKIDLRNGIKDDQLFSEFPANVVGLGLNGCLKGITYEKVDYSNGKTAGIVEYYGGLATASYGQTLLSTGYAPFVDPGFSGKIFGVLAGSAFPKIIRKGDPLLQLREYEVQGKVKRLYGAKGLGSHYKK